MVTEGGYNTHWTGGVSDRATSYHDRDDVLVYQTERPSNVELPVVPLTDLRDMVIDGPVPGSQ